MKYYIHLIIFAILVSLGYALHPGLAAGIMGAGFAWAYFREVDKGNKDETQ
jgi:hypothetical protein